MKRKLALGLALLMILMVVSATSIPTLATTYQLGVQPGNTATYTISETANKNVTKGQLSVENATGTVAGLDITYYFSNGTLAKSLNVSALVDVASTNGSELGFIFLIAKNLTAGDPVYPTASLTLNETTTLIAAGVNRTVNLLTVGGLSFYWDKLTGIIVKMNFGLFGSWFNATMTATNMWSPAGLFGLSTTELLVIGVVAIIVIIAAVVLLRRRK